MSDPPAARSGLSFGFWARLLLSAGLIAWLLYRISPADVLAQIRTADPALLAAAFGLHIVGFTLSAWRWRILLAPIVDRVCSQWLLMRAYLIGIFCNQFLPSTIGGDVYRAVDAARLNGIDRGRSLAIVFVERLIGAVALFSYALLAALIWFDRLIDKPGVVASLAALAGVFTIAFVALTPFGRRVAGALLEIGPLRKIRPAVERAFGAVKDLGRERRAIGYALGISFVFQLNVVLHYVLVGAAFDLALPTIAYFLVIPIVLLVLQLPLSINGIGLRETAFVLFLGARDLWGDQAATETQAFAYGAAVYAMIVLQGIIGGVFFGLRRRDLTSRTDAQ